MTNGEDLRPTSECGTPSPRQTDSTSPGFSSASWNIFIMMMRNERSRTCPQQIHTSPVFLYQHFVSELWWKSIVSSTWLDGLQLFSLSRQVGGWQPRPWYNNTDNVTVWRSWSPQRPQCSFLRLRVQDSQVWSHGGEASGDAAILIISSDQDV